MRLKYVMSEVVVGLWRNVTMTIAMIITMTVSLTLLGSSVVLFWQVNEMRDLYYQQIEVTIFLKVAGHDPGAEGCHRVRPQRRHGRGLVKHAGSSRPGSRRTRTSRSSSPRRRS